MSTRYLEIDSSFRDRNTWPNASEFEIPVSQSGRAGNTTARDPISDSAAITFWEGNNFQSDTPGSISIQITVEPAASRISAASGQFTIIASATAGQLQTADEYYLHAVAVNNATTPAESRRIVKYEYLGNDTARITFVDKFPTSLIPGDVLDISDPTTNNLPNDPQFFVPSGSKASNAYTGMFLYNETLNQSRPITGYDNVTGLLTVDTYGTAVSPFTKAGPTTAWQANHTYSIRSTQIASCGQLDGDIVFNPTTHNVFNLPTLQPSSQDLVGSFLEISNVLAASDRTGVTTSSGTANINLSAAANADNDFFIGGTLRFTSGLATGLERPITGYNGATQLATFDPPFPYVVLAGASYEITMPRQSRRIVKYVNSSGVSVNGGTTFIDLPSQESDINDYYRGLYIVVNATDIRLISGYEVTRDPITGLVLTRRAKVVNAFTAPAVAGTPYEIRSGNVDPGFTSSIALQDYCILPFTADNLVPFIYTGSLNTQPNLVCYDIELINLVLPNEVLNSGKGGRIANYPYVYVEISNISAASGATNNAIWSNNPNSTRSVFRCAVEDVSNPLTSPFIKLNGKGMTQTLKFQPNDDLRFAVRLPNGDLFATLEPEIFGPNRPNPKIQISALFGLTIR